VLSKRTPVRVFGKDVYVTVSGGLRVTETAGACFFVAPLCLCVTDCPAQSMRRLRWRSQAARSTGRCSRVRR
jgi:predicted ATP-dependent serine protease